MLKTLEKLCLLNSPSGDEGAVRDFIIGEIKDFCQYRIDNLGNIIAFKKGKNTPNAKILLDAHMDEVGLIITSVTSEGFLKFATVGGIDTAVMISRRVIINGNVTGVIGLKPVHLCHGDEGKKLPKADSLYIDIGVKSKEEALSLVSLGDTAVICGDYVRSGDKILSKALDDRIGCAILISLLKEESEYDFYATFSVQEEVGLRGAKVATFAVAPDFAIILEGTTAADIADVAEEKQVCNLGNGAAVSFMDRSTLYDKGLYNLALSSGIPCQSKRFVSGGNNAGAVHLSREGVRTVAVSVPCRYIHSASSVADIKDIDSAYKLAKYLILSIAEKKV
ncbi:MAG: M42 family peptidase [Clostridia bacterium]|nr:M42 family peptidase [Clostridia bacterium]